jgi:hypothetical protein
MKELEREKYEKQLLEVIPELDEFVFELDDYDVKDLVEKIGKSQQLAV